MSESERERGIATRAALRAICSVMVLTDAQRADVTAAIAAALARDALHDGDASQPQVGQQLSPNGSTALGHGELAL